MGWMNAILNTCASNIQTSLMAQCFMVRPLSLLSLRGHLPQHSRVRPKKKAAAKMQKCKDSCVVFCIFDHLHLGTQSLPKKVLEMNSETWFPERLISDRCVNSRFNILLNCKRERKEKAKRKCYQWPPERNYGKHGNMEEYTSNQV